MTEKLFKSFQKEGAGTWAGAVGGKPEEGGSRRDICKDRQSWPPLALEAEKAEKSFQ